MTYAIHSNLLTFEEFLEWHPEDGCNFELFDGIPKEMTNPTGPHEALGGFLSLELGLHCRQFHPHYFLPLSATVKPQRQGNAYKPDLILLDRTQLIHEPLWKSRSSIIHGATIPLIIEIVSTNWRDDYDRKLSDYEEMGIGEYWLVDYRALAAVRAIGGPKQPTFTVCHLVDGVYELQRFHRGDRLISPTLPNLNLSINTLFEAAETDE